MERQFINQLRQLVPPHAAVPLGIGDDAAVVQTTDSTLVTVDLLTDRVDFDLREHPPRLVGRKALAVSLSDIAAMGGTPLAAFVAFVVPKDGGRHLAEELTEGIRLLAQEYQVALAGGDTNSWDGPLVISTTVLGRPHAKGPLTRAGAKPGDRILATGEFGGSILGHHFDFRPRLQEIATLLTNYEVHAAIDVSDGLATDLTHILDESGLGAVIDPEKVPIRAAARELADQPGSPRTLLDHVLGDGEDFELLLAVPPESAAAMLADQPVPIPLTDIGEFIPEPGLWLQSGDLPRRPVEVVGWEHELS